MYKAGGRIVETLLDYLDDIEDILDQSKPNPITKKAAVDKELIFDIIRDIRLNLPSEIRHAQKIIEDHDRIINDARAKANHLLLEADNKAAEMTSSHQIYQMAVEQARELIEETKEKSAQLRYEATEYADKLLAQTEDAVKKTAQLIEQQHRDFERYVRETLELLHDNRQELRGKK